MHIDSVTLRFKIALFFKHARTPVKLPPPPVFLICCSLCIDASTVYAAAKLKMLLSSCECFTVNFSLKAPQIPTLNSKREKNVSIELSTSRRFDRCIERLCTINRAENSHFSPWTRYPCRILALLRLKINLISVD